MNYMNINKLDKYSVVIIVYIFFSFSLLFSKLEFHQATIDEGLYILQSKAIASGKIPYKDFTTHLPPVYIGVLSLKNVWDKNSNNQLAHYRVLSYFTTIMAATIVFLIVKRFVVAKFALLAVCLFAFTSLSAELLTATPSSLMLMFFLLSVYFVLQEFKFKNLLLSAVFSILSLSTKPLMLPACLTIFIFLLLHKPNGKKKIIIYLLSMFALGVFLGCYFEYMSKGYFLETLLFHVKNTLMNGSFKSYNETLVVDKNILESLANRPIWSMAWGNHVSTFYNDRSLSSAFWFFIFSLLGGISIFVRGKNIKQLFLIFVLPWIMLFLFSLFVWRFTRYNHFNYYLFYMAFLTTYFFDYLMELTKKFKWNSIVNFLIFSSVIIYCTFSMQSILDRTHYLNNDNEDVRALNRIKFVNQKVLSFN
ncbi:MAG: glycosyltransferase family 39 protein, partial [Oligoflexia bacterium]|nr:glycosyltransferase family 39 protein [Oligoflexia bacterium]